MAVKTGCPAAEDFQLLLKHGIPAEESEGLLGHLEACPHCWETIAPLLESDTLLDGVAPARPNVAPNLISEMLALNPAVSTRNPGAMSGTPADFSANAEAEALPPLVAIGHYQVVRLLGRGGMGAVYLATDSRLNRPVALKVMLPKFAANAAARERFLREARAAAQITHDNVVTVYEAGESDGVPFIAMQFLAGSSLEDALRKHHSFSISQILRIAEETTAGLAAAHAIGLVHRDIKPGNLWLEAPHGRVKVLDFGLAKPLDAEIELTRQGALIGTPAYMSPEQARGKPVDGRTDLFSLGAVLYRLCTGKLPFEGPTTIAILMALGSDDPIPVRELNAEVPPPLADLIHDLLAKNLDARPRTAAEVVDRLRSLSTATYTVTAAMPIKPRIAGKWIAAGFAAFLACLAAGVMIVIKNKDGTETKIAAPDGATVTVTDNAGKPLAIITDAEDAAWEKSVAAMNAEQQTQAVSARLKQVNPKFDEKSIFYTIEKGAVVAMEVRNASELAELKPIRALVHLNFLYFDGSFRNPSDISPLKGLKLTDLHFNGCPIKDVSPLKGMPLVNCYFWGNMTTDLSPLAGMKFVRTNVGHSRQKSLEVFRGMPLEFICMNLSAVDDLSPLQDCPLKKLEISNTKITDLAPVRGKPIEFLAIDGTKINDLTVLKSLALKTLIIDDPQSHRELLLSIPTLITINYKPAAEVLGERTNGSVAEWVLSLGGEITIAGQLQPVRRIADLPKAPFTIARVSFFDNRGISDAGLVRLTGETELQTLILYNTPITDAGLIHVGKLAKLTRLDLGHTKVTDAGLDHIRGLKSLRHLFVHYTGVTDLWLVNLKGFPELEELNLNGAMTDEGLVHLVGCTKLNDLSMQHAKVTDAGLEVIARIPSLTRINVKNTKVTAPGLAKFHAARPTVKIDHDGGTIEAEK